MPRREQLGGIGTRSWYGHLQISNGRGPAMALSAAIFDVDGVLVASPHERAWREALAGFADPADFTTAFYQANVAGRRRLEGARSALEQLGAVACREGHVGQHVGLGLEWSGRRSCRP